MAQNKKHAGMSAISRLHVFKLVIRSLMFLVALVVYVYKWWVGRHTLAEDPRFAFPVLAIIWIMFVVEMALRFFPSKLESMGCQKQFRKNYMPTGREKKLDSWRSTLAVAAAWFALNGVIGLLYFLGVIEQGVLLLIALFYSVCDMICILFFCPFQTWFMKNKCCGSCRIYNWDYAMMFTPFVFIPNFYTYSLLFLSLALLVSWEVYVRRFPERFMEATNAALACKNCPEKLCAHKKQLQHFLKANRARFYIEETIRKINKD